MLQMFGKGIRGGVSTTIKRYAKANNKYMNRYNPKKDNKFIIYLDANNLCGWAMSKKLPTHGFKWMCPEELGKWDVFPMEKQGRILEVDLEYPESIPDKHNDYPLAPESLKVRRVGKLIPHLGERKNYVLHVNNLKQYLKLGMKLAKIQRGIKFFEADWLKSYIDLNTQLRANAKSDFEKDFF